GFGIGRKAAEKPKQSPSADSAREIEKDVASHHRQQANAKHEIEMEISVGGNRASSQQCERGGHWKTDRLGEAHHRQKQVAMMRNRCQQVVHVLCGLRKGSLSIAIALRMLETQLTSVPK